jgi:hypothetical protein
MIFSGSYWLRGSVSVIVALNATLIIGCASFGQQMQDVYWRRDGGQLEPWKKLPDAAAIHWPYAWAAVAAYQDSDDPKRKPLMVSITCPEPHIILEKRGWFHWSRLPTIKPREVEPYPIQAQKMRHNHLRAEVWSNAQTKQVVIAFGGTAAISWDDWKANGRWLFGTFNSVDQYSVLTDIFMPMFVAEYQQLQSHSDWAWLKDAKIVTTGHSLGGGLAQRFAYSMHKGFGLPVVKEVYAFDPSPVSGKRDAVNFSEQAAGLVIYRIYNRGETLAGLRILERFVNPSHQRNQGQKWIDIRYLANWSWRTLLPTGSVHAHGIHDLARFMIRNLPPEDNPECTGTEDK